MSEKDEVLHFILITVQRRCNNAKKKEPNLSRSFVNV